MHRFLRPRSAPLLASLAMGLSTACLPNDTRPPPGKVLVTVSPDEALSGGITSVDGWEITFDRFLVSLGHVSLEGDDCLSYSNPEYARVLDLARPGPQKLSLVYAVGHCDFDVELSSPQADSVLGAGTTEADRTFLRTPGDDAFTEGSGISIFAEGSATREGVTKTFAWAFRQRVDYATCSVTVDGEVVTGFDIASGASKTLDILARGGALFATDRTGSSDDIRFQAFADADSVTGDGDGAVTLDELSRIDLSDLAATVPLPPIDSGPDRLPYTSLDRWTTLQDFLYLGMFPLSLRWQGNGTCAMEVFPNNRVPR